MRKPPLHWEAFGHAGLIFRAEKPVKGNVYRSPGERWSSHRCRQRANETFVPWWERPRQKRSVNSKWKMPPWLAHCKGPHANRLRQEWRQRNAPVRRGD